MYRELLHACMHTAALKRSSKHVHNYINYTYIAIGYLCFKMLISIDLAQLAMTNLSCSSVQHVDNYNSGLQSVEKYSFAVVQRYNVLTNPTYPSTQMTILCRARAQKQGWGCLAARFAVTVEITAHGKQDDSSIVMVVILENSCIQASLPNASFISNI